MSNNNRTVWSSSDGDLRKKSNLTPSPSPERRGASLPPQQQTAYLHRESGGRGGKVVSVVKNLNPHRRGSENSRQKTQTGMRHGRNRERRRDRNSRRTPSAYGGCVDETGVQGQDRGGINKKGRARCPSLQNYPCLLMNRSMRRRASSICSYEVA